jgi:5-methylcytosine-specific restriction endonuclease McrA
MSDRPEHQRSSHWPAARAAHLQHERECAACGGKDHLEVHHIIPFSWPGGSELELVDSNLITLCESPSHNCHLWVGHLGDYRSRNPDVRRDAAAFRAKIKARPYPNGPDAHE